MQRYKIIRNRQTFSKENLAVWEIMLIFVADKTPK